MRLDTLIKMGSLAFSIAQDEKVREMATLIHRGARRRGLLGPWPPSLGTPSTSAASTADKGAEEKAAKSSSASPAASSAPSAPAAAAPALPPALRRYINRRTARRLAHMTRTAASLLIDPPRPR
ncbi:MAG: hypothetical protein IRZ10_05705 [Thermoflavifilum sp.]|nr:hypothetical protein [Thermoflavifilum sp.]MCL6513899.1 hypothetical protein [Alicyclobacillus sp.]